jgi:hypothetical protein
MGTRAKWTWVVIVVLVLVSLVFFVSTWTRDTGVPLTSRASVAPSTDSARDERASGEAAQAMQPLSIRVLPSARTGMQAEPRTYSHTPPSRAARTPLPSRGTLALQGFSGADDALIDRVAIELEGEDGRGGGTESDIARLNRAFETESRNSSWAAPIESDLAAWMQASYGPFRGVRVGTPICKASVCMLRAIGPIGLVRAGPGFNPLPQLPMHEPLWRDRFESMSTFVALRNGEAVHLIYLFRHCTRAAEC